MQLGERDSFGSKFGVIAAAAGSAIGLGNIWRFPYVAGENGGGAFLLIYLIFIVAIGIPVMMSEFVIGRSAQLNAVGSFQKIAPGKKWHLIGLLGVVTAFVILAFYTVVAGWTLEYLVQSARWIFSEEVRALPEISQHLEGEEKARVLATNREYFQTHFSSFKDGIWRPVVWFVVMMFFTGYIVISGVKNGIEKYAKILMPVLLVLLLVLMIRSLTLEGASKGLDFLFNPDFSRIREEPGKIILEALGQAFFSLSVGMGTLITYGSYIRKKENLASTAVSVSLADTFIAILAGVVIFPAVFSLGIDADSGPELVYITLPVIFRSMPGGLIWAFMFFLLLCFAALTSTISVLEVIVAYFTEQLKMTRRRAAILAMISVGFLGLLCTLSAGIFGVFNASPDLLLPLGGFFIVIFVGWFLAKKTTKNELSSDGTFRIRYYGTFRFMIRYVAPLAIAALFLLGLNSRFGELARQIGQMVVFKQ